MNKDKKETEKKSQKQILQWHPAFESALELELLDNKADLTYKREYNLNRKPLEIDFLILKTTPGAEIKNDIGKIFRGHNIVEYKSPDAELTIDTCHKVEAYAHLYKAYGKTVDAIKEEDVTVSLIRNGKPDKVFHYFEEHSIYSVTNPMKGIYYVKGFHFPTQIIVASELATMDHIWLKALSPNLTKEDMEYLLQRAKSLQNTNEIELADSVIYVSVRDHQNIFYNFEEDEEMTEEILQYLEPLLIKRDQKRDQERNRKLIESLRCRGHDDLDILSILKETYELSEEEAESLLESTP